MGRLQPRHAPALLVDQDRHVAAGEVAQAVGQRAQLVRVDAVAFENDIPGGVGVAEQRALVVAERRAGDAEEQRGHCATTHSTPAIFSRPHRSTAAAVSATPVARRRYSVVPPRSTGCTDLPSPARYLKRLA